MSLTKVSAQMVGGGTGQAFAPSTPIYENTQSVTSSYTITTGSSAMSVGPLTIPSGVVVTIPAGSKWVIL
jgi:hypothetical protein